MPDKKRGKKRASEALEIEDDPAPSKTGKGRKGPVVITIDDEPAQGGPGPARVAHDKRTKQQLLELIAQLEAERKTFQGMLEANQEDLEHQRAVDNRAGKELYEATKAELDQTKSELARIAARDRRLRARVLEVRDELIKLRDQHGCNPVVIGHADSEMLAVGEELVDLTHDP